MRRKFHFAGKGRDDQIRIADASGRIVCLLPRDERRLAQFIVRFTNMFGFGLKTYDSNDWWMERNPARKHA